MMENFYLATLALAKSASLHIGALFWNPFFEGFAFGFLFAVLISSLVITKDPVSLCTILLYKDPQQSINMMERLDQSVDIRKKYSNFELMHTVVRLLFAASLFVFFLFISLSFITFSLS